MLDIIFAILYFGKLCISFLHINFDKSFYCANLCFRYSILSLSLIIFQKKSNNE